MKQLRTYHNSIRRVIYLLLVCQLWVFAMPYCYWMMDAEADLIELRNVEDAESEEEENKKEKEEKDEFRFDLYAVTSTKLTSNINILHLQCFLTLHHPEIVTPPPESFMSLT